MTHFRTIYFAVLVLALCCVATAKPARSALREVSGEVVVGKALPSFGRYEVTDSEKLVTTGRLLKALQGVNNGRLVVVFFNVGCVPCREGLVTLRDSLAPSATNPVSIVLVDVSDPLALVSRYLQELHLPFPCVWDEQGEIARSYGVYQTIDGKEQAVVPVTVVADGQGKVLRMMGAEGRDYLELLQK